MCPKVCVPESLCYSLGPHYWYQCSHHGPELPTTCAWAPVPPQDKGDRVTEGSKRGTLVCTTY